MRIPVELNFDEVTDEIDPGKLRSLCEDNPHCKGGPSAADHSECPVIYLLRPEDVTTQPDAITIKGWGRLRAKTPVPPMIVGITEIYIGSFSFFADEDCFVEFVDGRELLASSMAN